MTHAERDLKAKTHASDYLNSEALLLNILVDMLEADSFLALGYPSLFVYCLERLKLSPAQASYYQKVARKSVEVPELKQAIEQGELSLSQGRRIVPVLTPENKDEWIQKAKDLSQKDLEKEVSDQNPHKIVPEKIKPICRDRKEMKVGISGELEKKLLRVKDLLSQKLKRSVTLEEALVAMADGFLRKNDPLEKKAKIPSSRKIPARGRHPISASLKNAVYQRDSGQCTEILPTGKRCPERRFLQFHHSPAVSDGGLNTLEHLSLRCSAHHRKIHRMTA